MKIGVSILVLVVGIVVVVVLMRSLGDDVSDIRSGFERNREVPEFPEVTMPLIDWAKPVYTTIPPKVPEEAEFEIMFCVLESVSAERGRVRCTGTISSPREGTATIKCEGYASAQQARRDRPVVAFSAERFEVESLVAQWTATGLYSLNKQVEVARCAVYGWPT